MEYFFSKNYNGFIYTIDMFRISTRISIFDKKEIVKFLSTRGLKFWTNKSSGKYDENFMADKLWIGIMKEVSHDLDYTINENFLLSIEFNPNKISDFDIFLYNYFINHYNFKIKRFDLAVDIPHNINNLCFFDVFKKSYSVFYKDYNNKTFYIGKGDGHIKIYNKKIESNLDYELTRFEITKEVDFDFNNYAYIDFRFPYIAYQPYLSSSDTDDVCDSLDAIIFAVNNGYPYKNLSRTYKSKIRKDFTGLSDLSNDVANEVCLQFINFIKSGISNKPDNLHYLTFDK